MPNMTEGRKPLQTHGSETVAQNGGLAYRGTGRGAGLQTDRQTDRQTEPLSWCKQASKIHVERSHSESSVVMSVWHLG